MALIQSASIELGKALEHFELEDPFGNGSMLWLSLQRNLILTL